MTNGGESDKRRQQKQAENLFYLELRHAHNGNINSMLSDDERIIWDCFTDEHKNLFKNERDWEWKLMCSLKRFSDARFVTKCSDWKEIAVSRMRQYQQVKESCESYMSLDDLMDFLFPLVDLGGDRFREEVIEQIKREDALSPRAFTEEFTEEWELYEVGQLKVMMDWLALTNNSYLRQGAAVWRSYSGNSERLVNSQDAQSKKTSVEIEKNPDWEYELRLIREKNSCISYHQACIKLSKKLKSEGEKRCSVNSVKKYTTKW